MLDLEDSLVTDKLIRWNNCVIMPETMTGDMFFYRNPLLCGLKPICECMQNIRTHEFLLEQHTDNWRILVIWLRWGASLPQSIAPTLRRYVLEEVQVVLVYANRYSFRIFPMNIFMFFQCYCLIHVCLCRVCVCGVSEWESTPARY